MSSPPPSHRTSDENLALIVHHLERLDKRDRLRTYGAFIHGILSFIPLLILLSTLWYVYNNGAELLQQVTTEAAKQAATYSAEKGSDWMNQLQNMMKR